MVLCEISRKQVVRVPGRIVLGTRLSYQRLPWLIYWSPTLLKIEDGSRGLSEHLYAPEIVSRLNQPGVCLNSQVMTMDIGSEAA